MPFRWTPLGETALVVEFGAGERIDPAVLHQVWALARHLERQPLPGVTEIVTGYATVTLLVDPLRVTVAQAAAAIAEMVPQLRLTSEPESRLVEIPVCYSGRFGPDLPFVAEHNGLSVAEVIEQHGQTEYLVYLIGFAPGFPYLGGMSRRIAAPRLETPRLEVPAGSVGIAGEQTGIYPFAMPGGWRLIGRTPVPLFRPDASPPTLLQAGDRVRFRAIAPKEFEAWSEGQPCPLE